MDIELQRVRWAYFCGNKKIFDIDAPRSRTPPPLGKIIVLGKGFVVKNVMFQVENGKVERITIGLTICNLFAYSKKDDELVSRLVSRHLRRMQSVKI